MACEHRVFSLLPVQTVCEFVTWHSENGSFVYLKAINIYVFHSEAEAEVQQDILVFS